MLSIIAAVGKHRVIGANNGMLWYMPADLRFFNRMSVGKPIVMGRRTFESLGKALPNRRNIVLSRSPGLLLSGCEVFKDFTVVLKALANEPEIMVIGGAQIYQQALPLATRMYLTHIDCDATGDAYFPEWEGNGLDWQLIGEEKHSADDRNPYDYTFCTYERTINK